MELQNLYEIVNWYYYNMEKPDSFKNFGCGFLANGKKYFFHLLEQDAKFYAFVKHHHPDLVKDFEDGNY